MLNIILRREKIIVVKACTWYGQHRFVVISYFHKFRGGQLVSVRCMLLVEVVTSSV